MKTFEQFLQEMHFKMNPQLLDDDLSNSFDTWISEMEGHDMMEWADLYGRDCNLKGKEEILISN